MLDIEGNSLKVPLGVETAVDGQTAFELQTIAHTNDGNIISNLTHLYGLFLAHGKILQ